MNPNGTAAVSDEGQSMLRSLRDFALHQMRILDSELGAVVDFLLPNDDWKVRYLLVEPDALLERRLVRVVPTSIGLTEGTMKRQPPAPSKGRVPSGSIAANVVANADRTLSGAAWCHNWAHEGTKPPDDIDLRSARECLGYQIRGTNATLGRMYDIIVDDETWEVRYLVIDTRKWWFRKLVLVTARSAIRICQSQRTICVERTREAVRKCPPWVLSAAINRAYCSRLCDRFGQSGIALSR